MTIYEPSDVGKWEEFELSWRFTDPKWDLLDNDTLARILPLTHQKEEEIFKLSLEVREHYIYPHLINHRNYHAVSDVSLDEEKTDSDIYIPEWFSGLNLDDAESIYCCWSHVRGNPAVVTDWSVLKTYWNSFFYPFDTITVFDETLDWAVLFGMEENAVYAVRGGVDPNVMNFRELKGCKLNRHPSPGNESPSVLLERYELIRNE